MAGWGWSSIVHTCKKSPVTLQPRGDFYIAISMRSMSQTTHFSQPRFSG